MVPPDFFDRYKNALALISKRFKNPEEPLTIKALNTIPAYTGYSPGMIQFTLGSLDMMPVDSLEEITRYSFPSTIHSHFTKLQGSGDLTGYIRFFGSGINKAIRKLIPTTRFFKMQPNYPDTVLGFAAGNVIGTSHLIGLLAQVSALIQPDSESIKRKFPLIVVKNSRQEPLFTPFILSAIEAIDPLLVSSIGIMIWDYDDSKLQEMLISKSDLILAAAADFTIDEIDRVIQKVQNTTKSIRFHRHGHKISFSTISSSYLARKKAPSIPGDIDMIHLTTLLSSVDSIYWDQNGCLSSRIHFVQRGASETFRPEDYGIYLAEKIRILSTFLPRGDNPLHNLHNRFDKYAALSISGNVKICSTYEDDFLVVVDERPWTPTTFNSVINDCVDRTIIIRPIDDIFEVPNSYLNWLPKKNLQTMSVAIDGPERDSWSPRFSKFAEAIGKRGVTGIRTIGRGPFPQLAYSWDGYIPLDLSLERNSGYFTTVQFDNNYRQIVDTFQLYSSKNIFQ
jgi:hypothetical protein